MANRLTYAVELTSCVVDSVLANMSTALNPYLQSPIARAFRACILPPIRTSPRSVDLAGDGGGDQSGATFLQQVDGSLGFGGEGIKLRSSSRSSAIDDCRLLIQRRNW